MTCYDINERVNVPGRLRVVDESAGENGRVLERESEFLRSARGFTRIPEILEIEFHAWRDDVGEFELGVEEGGGGEDLCDGEACIWMPECQC